MVRCAGNQLMVKENNQKFIIDTLINSGSKSRAELAKLLKLSAPSISNNISQLLSKNILLEAGEGDSIGGRRPVLVEFNYNYGYIVGMDFSSRDLKIALGNLKAEIIAIKSVPVSDAGTAEEMIRVINENISGILKEHNVKQKNLLAIAIGLPGIFSRQNENIYAPPSWLNLSDKKDIKAEIAKKFKAEVIIKNDINLATLGESRYGAGKEYDNLVYVNVDMGVGGGVIINNMLYEGRRLAAGEIGYFSTNLNDVNYYANGSGPLESRISIPAVISRVKNEVENGCSSCIPEIVDGDIQKINLDVISEAIKRKDSYTNTLMYDISKELSIAVSNICALLDLDLIILGGELMNIGYDFLDPINTITGRLTPLGTKVMYSCLGSNAVIYGAFAIALEYIFNRILEL